MLVSAFPTQPLCSPEQGVAGALGTATHATKVTPRKPGRNHHPKSKQLRSTRETNPTAVAAGELQRAFCCGTAEPCETSALAGTRSAGAARSSMQTQPEPCIPLPDGPLKPSTDPRLPLLPSPRALTTPFSTQKPSWYFESGRRMTAVVTGGQCTMFSVTSVWCFSSWKMGWGFVRLWRPIWRG